MKSSFMGREYEIGFKGGIKSGRNRFARKLRLLKYDRDWEQRAIELVEIEVKDTRRSK